MTGKFKPHFSACAALLKQFLIKRENMMPETDCLYISFNLPSESAWGHWEPESVNVF